MAKRPVLRVNGVTLFGEDKAIKDYEDPLKPLKILEKGLVGSEGHKVIILAESHKVIVGAEGHKVKGS